MLGVLADPADYTDIRREGSSDAASSGCHGEGGGEVCEETAIIGKVKEEWIIIQRVVLMLCPNQQVMNGVGLHAHVGRAMISYQPPSSVQQAKDLMLLIDLSGQCPRDPQKYNNCASLIAGWLHCFKEKEKDTKWK